MNYAMYGLSLFLAGGPLVYILYNKQFSTYFPYFIANASFMALNLVGSLSSNITTNYNNLGFYGIGLITSCGFFMLFLGLKKLAVGRYEEIKVRVHSNNLMLSLKKNRNFLFGASLASLLAMLIFSLCVSPPFFLITKTLEQKPSAQLLQQQASATTISTDLKSGNRPVTPPINEVLAKIASTHPSSPQTPDSTSSVVESSTYSARSTNLLTSRISIVATRSFHWFALFGFELPMFLSVLTMLGLCFALSQKAAKKLKREWIAYMIAIFALSYTASFWILSKQYPSYLIASLFLTFFVYKNQISIKYVAILAVFFLSVLGLLYGFYTTLPLNALFHSVGTILYHRIFEVYPWISAIVYSLFPGTYQYLDGQSVPNIFHVVNYQFVSLGNLIYPYIYMTTGGSAPVPAIFESYANWGWLGVFGSELIIFLTIFGVTVLSWSKNLFLIALAIYMSIKLILFWQAPFWFGVFESTWVLFCMVLFAVYKLLYRHDKVTTVNCRDIA